MIEDFFDHKCNIFHLRKTEESPGFALPVSPEHTYPAEPDISEQPCHFGVKTASVTTVQGEPAKNLESRIKLGLPVGTDIRLNDKVVDCDTGLVYTAELPRNIRNHHLFCYIKREEKQRPL